MNEPARLIKQVVQNIEYQVNVLDRLVLAAYARRSRQVTAMLTVTVLILLAMLALLAIGWFVKVLADAIDQLVEWLE